MHHVFIGWDQLVNYLTVFLLHCMDCHLTTNFLFSKAKHGNCSRERFYEGGEVIFVYQV